ncbi:GumC family protein [Flavobacterium sp. PL02]|uniref:GumC family protein n=1 Tax=Flavobacterium sp. PL02 TaxID=3088354 RepID=UPI002B239B00|nr:polysaccharide biosynthesis tyrosine autokinase [Flavobacterium sp. PL02]MEA9414121.1 polysaccharide biosynthesis tyrosine autokinase [Flavobacterium sp. PL02]
MNKNTNKNSFLGLDENESSINITEAFKKYLRYWPWFLGSILLSLIIAFTFLRYADVIYTTEAKVKLIDDKKNTNFSLDMSKVFSKSAINLENEIALFNSYRLSEQVVQNLKLNVIYISKGKINSKINFNPPFVINYALPQDSLSDIIRYDISITKTGYTILDTDSGKTLKTKGYWLNKPLPNFPITIQPSANESINSFVDNTYQIILKPIRVATLELTKAVQVTAMGKDSDIISLVLKNSDGQHAQVILNNLIKVFEEDGIKDNQQVSRRTIDFVDNRFVYLKQELDAIEISKKDYKTSNNLSFIQEDAGVSIKIKSDKEQALFDVESQLLLVKLLQDNLFKQSGFDLLPADIGVQNATINQLIAGYNTLILEYQKLQTSAGSNNPSVQVVLSSLKNQKDNIINSIKGYKQQLETTRNQGVLAQRTADGAFSTLPEKEKVLRSIERQQNLKENLYLLLLQKREEASINLAVTVPNTKIIDYAITNNIPIYPKTSFVFLMALMLGLFIPFGALYLLFKFDNKIYSTNDIEKINYHIPILGELPSLQENKNENNEANLEVLEAFRTLVHNTEFITPFDDTKKGKIFFVTSSIKGEGKTFVSFNLANTLAQLGKKILIVGTDLRNPQLHKHLDQSKLDNKGLSNYLHNSSLEWQDLLYKNKTNDFSFDVLLSGDIPPNPILLLSSKRFTTFANEIKELYDIIVFDTPPTLLVSDSLIISKYADTTLYVVRSGMTEKKLISYSSKLNEDKKLNNMGYVINDIASGYNYGHNYGYGRYVEKKTLFKRLFKK